MDANGVAEIKDFSRPGGLTPKQFRIDDDVFSMASSIPFGSLGEIAKLQGIMVGALNSADDADRSIAGITEVFAVFMHPESLARFKERPRLGEDLADRIRTRVLVPSDAAAYLSRLRPGGAVYEILASAPLRAL